MFFIDVKGRRISKCYTRSMLNGTSIIVSENPYPKLGKSIEIIMIPDGNQYMLDNTIKGIMSNNIDFKSSIKKNRSYVKQYMNWDIITGRYEKVIVC